MLIDDVIDEVIGREGGFSNHQSDAGGPTKWGITAKVAHANGFVGELRDLSRDEAVRIYRSEYWIRPRLDLIARLAPQLAAEIFDTGVNMGPRVAAAFLQRVLNGLNRNQRDYPDIEVDGVIGVRTSEALRQFLDRRGQQGETVLLKAIEALQGALYLRLAEQRPANEAFLYGWLANRLG